MNKIRDWVGLLVAISLLVVGAPLVVGLHPTLRVEAQQDPISVAPTTLTITEGAGSGAFTFTLVAAPATGTTVTVPLSISNSTYSNCGLSASSVELNETNWSTGVEVTVSDSGDTVADGTQTCTVVTGTSTSGDADYNNKEMDDVTVTVTDDETANIVVNPTTGLIVNEPSGTDTFNISLTSQPVANVVINLGSSDPTECSVPSSVTLNSGNWSGQAVTVTAVNDDVDDGNKPCTVQTGTSSSPGTPYHGLTVADVSATVVDDDTWGITVEQPTVTTINESGAPTSTSFRIRLESEPTANVSIDLSTPSGQCTAAPDPVVLTGGTGGNWSAGVLVTITAVNDAIDDGDLTCTVVTANSTSSDPNYNNKTVDDVTPITVVDDDTWGITVVQPSPPTVYEGGTGGSSFTLFTIKLDSQPTDPVSISLSTSNAQCGLSNYSVTIQPGEWNVGALVNIIAVNDLIDDGDQPCTAVTENSTSPDPLYNNKPVDDVTVTVVDDDTWGITVEQPTVTTINESGAPTSTSFRIRLNSQPTANVSVDLSTPSGQCTAAPDPVVLTSGASGTWLAGVEVTITAVNDAIDDGNLTCTVVTANSTSGDANYSNKPVDDVIPITVVDDDTAGITVVQPTVTTISEPDGSTSFTIRLNSQPTADVTVDLSTSNNQCTAAPDPVVLTSGNWSGGVPVTITAVNDAIDDGTLSCTVVTAASTSPDPLYNNTFNPDNVTVSVADDDTAGITVEPTELTISEPDGSAAFTIRLDSQPTFGVYVPLGRSNTECSINRSYVYLTSSNWSTGLEVIVTAVDDDLDDETQTCIVETDPAISDDGLYDDTDAADVTVNVQDDDGAGILVSPGNLTISEPDGSAAFTIRLGSQPTSGVTIGLSTTNSQCTISTGQVTLYPWNWSSGATVTVSAVNDAVVDGTQSCTVVTAASTSSDPLYNNVDAADVTVSVEDDDTAGILVSPTELSVSEPDGSDTFLIRLNSQPTANVTIDLSTSNNECAVSPDPVILTGGTSGNWSTGVQVTVSAVDDDVDDGTQICTVVTAQAQSDDTNYRTNPADVTVSVDDDDGAGIVLDPTSLTVSEPDGSAVFTVRLATEPTSNVSMPLAASNTECTVAPSEVTLTPANWQAGVSATVTAVNDGVVDGTQTCVIEVGPTTSADPNYHEQTSNGVEVTVLDRAIYVLHLPVVVHNWPPLPQAPVLNPISNADGDGAYSIGWSVVPGAELYILQQATQSTFSDAVQIYSGTATSQAVSGRGAGRYYYRVRARNEWGDGNWSNTRWADVLWEGEPNDQASQANGPLVSGLTYYGLFPSGADLQDYFYIDLPAPHAVELWLTNIAAGQDYNLVLRDALLQTVGYSAQVGSTNEQITTGVLPAGRYYVQVFNFGSGGSTQPYHLRAVYQ